jgi:dTDP-glucose 4,6-dehydratase
VQAQMSQQILVVGGAGFIGSNFILDWFKHEKASVLNLDLLTYAGSRENLSPIFHDDRYQFVQGDVNDGALLGTIFRRHEPRAVVHFAAETHVDRSINDPGKFIRTNIEGTFELLQAAKLYWHDLPKTERDTFRFLHVSTDEVYGSLGLTDPGFTERSPYDPHSPYAASKAASDHLVRAYHRTYGLPVLITNSSNNYGPRQLPEKFVPLLINNGLAGKPMPIYGDGGNIRDWIYVEDHCDAIRRVLSNGVPGDTYNIGGRSEMTNLEVVDGITAALQEIAPRQDLDYKSLIKFVADRPGHDLRYAVDISKMECELGWQPKAKFLDAIRRTVEWYVANPGWVRNALERLSEMPLSATQ